MERIILHCDLNNFFASAALTQNVTLKNMPVAICGDTEMRHGIVLAKNDLAKRCGVKTAETVWEAKNKCPNLISIAPDFKLYTALSVAARAIYSQYSDKVECFGIDECWVDISDPSVNFDRAVLIANDIRRRIKRELRITVSVGVSFNKYFAKLGSDLKKPDAVTRIDRENYQSIVWPLNCSALLMAGPKTVQSLRAVGIFTIGDLACASDGILKSKLGVNGLKLKKAALGEDGEAVIPFSQRALPKSIGRSATTPCDLTKLCEVRAAFIEFAEKVAFELRQYQLLAKGICITVVNNEFKGQEFRAPLSGPSNNSAILAKSGYRLFVQEYNFEKPVRSIGLRAIRLIREEQAQRQLNLFDDCLELEELEKIENSMMLIRQKYGVNSIKRAVCLNNRAELD